MAENEEIEGFENLDDLFGEESQASEEGAGAAAASEGIDDLLGEGGGEAAGGEAGEGGASDSELDSFFEDLSTIDDLEMTQEEAPPEQPPPAAAAAQPEPEPAAREQPRPEPRRRERRKGPGLLGRMFRLALPLLIVAGVGYGLYYYFWPKEGEEPWPTTQVPVQEEPAQVVEEPPPPPEPEPEPEPVAQPEPQPPPPEPEPEPEPEPAQPPAGRYGIQVATCFFQGCVDAFRERMEQRNLPVVVREKSQTREILEVYTRNRFADQDEAQRLAERINETHQLEGQAFVFQSNGRYRISMGNFTDLARANAVKDALNQRLGEQARFTTRLKDFPYSLKTVIGGRFPTREAARAARERLVQSDSRFSDAFVVRR